MSLLGVILEEILDVVMPLRARSARTKARTLGDIPLSPTAHDLLHARITTLMDYQRDEVQDLVRALKYDGSSHATAIAACILADYLREEISALRLFSTLPVLLVPIPLHASRTRERGFNQIEIVLRALPSEFKDGTLANFAPQALARVRATLPQTRLPRTDRLKNVSGAFAVPDPSLVLRTHVFLIDDVATTGATLAHASAPLTAAGADVSLIALARA